MDPQSPAHERCIEFVRVTGNEEAQPEFAASVKALQPVQIHPDGVIEEDSGSLQVDFANRFIGGGVLRSGCVQEEIRMALAPEMILARLFCEELKANEVLLMSGMPDFSETTGYGNTFGFRQGRDPWAGAVTPQLVPTPYVNAESGRRMQMHAVTVMAMDAYNFRGHGNASQQFAPGFVHRELLKAYIGFHGVPPEQALLPLVREGPVASGHWGCGAYAGDTQLKLILQWLAASEAGRELHYYTFDKPLPEFEAVRRRFMQGGQATVGSLLKSVLAYDQHCRQLHVESRESGGVSETAVGTPTRTPPAKPSLFEFLLS